MHDKTKISDIDISKSLLISMSEIWFCHVFTTAHGTKIMRTKHKNAVTVEEQPLKEMNSLTSRSALRRMNVDVSTRVSKDNSHS